MAEALRILRRHLDEAEAARRWHLAQKRVGNIDALVAGLKVGWLKALISECEARR